MFLISCLMLFDVRGLWKILVRRPELRKGNHSQTNLEDCLPVEVKEKRRAPGTPAIPKDQNFEEAWILVLLIKVINQYSPLF